MPSANPRFDRADLRQAAALLGAGVVDLGVVAHVTGAPRETLELLARNGRWAWYCHLYDQAIREARVGDLVRRNMAEAARVVQGQLSGVVGRSASGSIAVSVLSSHSRMPTLHSAVWREWTTTKKRVPREFLRQFASQASPALPSDDPGEVATAAASSEPSTRPGRSITPIPMTHSGGEQ